MNAAEMNSAHFDEDLALLQQLTERVLEGSDDPWDTHSTLVFRERMGCESVTLSEGHQTVCVNLHAKPVEQLLNGLCTPDNEIVLELEWDDLPLHQNLTTSEIHLNDSSEEMFIRVLLGLCDNKYIALRTLATTLFRKFHAKVTRLRYKPFSIEMSHASSSEIEKLGSKVNLLEDEVQKVIVDCTKTEVSLKLNMQLTVDAGKPDLDDDDMEFTLTIYGSETESEDVPVQQRSFKTFNTSNSEGFSLNGTPGLRENDVRLDKIEKEIHRQNRTFSEKFDKQLSQNAMIMRTIQSLSLSLQDMKFPHALPSGGHTVEMNTDFTMANTAGQDMGDHPSETSLGNLEESLHSAQLEEKAKVHTSEITKEETMDKDIKEKEMIRREQSDISDKENRVGKEEDKESIQISMGDDLASEIDDLSERSHETSKTTAKTSGVSDVSVRRQESAESGCDEDTNQIYFEDEDDSDEDASGNVSEEDVEPLLHGDGRTDPKVSQTGDHTDQTRKEQTTSIESSILQGDTGGRARQFLTQYGVRGTSPGVLSLIQTVESAMIDEDPMPPRATGLDTVLCLDTSESMGPEGFEEMKKAALELIDGIEDIAAEYEIEENVAIVSTGFRAEIVHHLSNDYSRVREAVENLARGGQTSLFESLLVSLCAINGRGGPLNMYGYHKVQPRIIVITCGDTFDAIDGFSVKDKRAKTTAQNRVLGLLEEFGSKKNINTFPQPIVWMRIGDSESGPLDDIDRLGNCNDTDCSQVRKLCRYQMIQQVIGRAYVHIKKKMISEEETDVSVDEITTVVNGIAGDLEEEIRDTVVSAIERKIELSQARNRPMNISEDFDNIVEFKSEQLPPLGTRVIRGPDWKWENQDSEGPGTVINHVDGDDDEKQQLWVLWDNGNTKQYRYGYKDCIDLKVVHDQPRITASDLVIEVGCEVKRGRDWKEVYNNQDGGEGQLGVVIRKNTRGKVKVRWFANGHINEYRYGKDNKLDLTIRDPAESLMEFTQSQDKHVDKLGGGDDDGEEEEEFEVTLEDSDEEFEQEEVAEATVWVWQWKGESRDWHLYPQNEIDRLEKEYSKRPTGSCIVKRDGANYRVMFKSKQEKKVEGGAKADVRRINVTISGLAALRNKGP